MSLKPARASPHTTAFFTAGRDGADRLEVAVRGDREAGLDDVDAHLVEQRRRLPVSPRASSRRRATARRRAASCRISVHGLFRSWTEELVSGPYSGSCQRSFGFACGVASCSVADVSPKRASRMRDVRRLGAAKDEKRGRERTQRRTARRRRPQGHERSSHASLNVAVPNIRHCQSFRFRIGTVIIHGHS